MSPSLFRKVSLFCLTLGALSLWGCSPVELDPNDIDDDGDGLSENQGDCNDGNSLVSPDLPEACDNVDNDCDGQIDEDFDLDGDGRTTCGGDCDDNDPNTFVGAPELLDGVDNDCDGIPDNNRSDTDDDGDGFTEDQGDCDDAEPLVGPGAIEFEGDTVDNDCDGQIDEPIEPCDGGLAGSNDPFDFAKAMGFCNGEVINAEFIGGIAASRAIAPGFGNNLVAFEGQNLIHLSSGSTGTGAHDPGTAFDGNTNLQNCVATAHPDPQGDPADGCGKADPANVCDLTALRLTIQVPINAQSFSFNHQFLSSEYPTFRCTDFDDTFIAFLESGAFTGNISFDANGNFVSVNNGFFQVCFDDDGAPNQFRPQPVPPNECTDDPVAPLSGTGYNPNGGQNSSSAGATLPLTTFSPVIPGEIITLTFQIFDEGDDILDSSILLDNFRWDALPVDGPKTIP